MNYQSIPSGRPILILLCLCLILVFNATSWAATPSEKESLRGLQGIILKPLIFTSTPVKIKDEIALSKLTTEIETQLHEANVLLHHPSLDRAQHPFLEIQGAVTQIAADYYAYTIVVALHQRAVLRRDGTEPWVVTWSQGALSTGDIRKFQERIRFLVGMFIQDYKKMNAEPSQSWPLSRSSTHL